MKSTARVLLSTALVAGIAAASCWVARENSDPIRIASRVAGLDLPAESKLIARDSEWHHPFGEGYAFLAFDVPESFAEQVRDSCEERGYTLAPFIGSGRRIFVLEQYFEPGEPSCYVIRGTLDQSEVMILQGDRLVVYVSA